MNIFFAIGRTVVTPELSGTILPGITRDSVIALLKSMAIPVEERPVSIDEIAAAHAAGPAGMLRHRHRGHDKPCDRDRLPGEVPVLPPVGDRHIAHAAATRLAAIRTGSEPDPFGWLIPV